MKTVRTNFKIMNSKQEAKLNMYRTTQQHCEKHAALIKNYPAFENGCNALSAKNAALIGTATAQSQVITGVAQDKALEKNNLCKMATNVGGLVFAFASKAKNNTLKQSVNYSYSDLHRLKDDLLVPVVNNIYQAAAANAAALQTYGVTDALLQAFKASIERYSEAVPRPRGAKSERITSADNAKQLIREIDALLKNELDKLVMAIEPDNPDFVATYKNCRFIYNPATQTTQLRGKVLNANGKVPVGNAVVELIGTTTMVAQTNKAGNFTIKPLAPGTYKVRLRAEGYADAELEELVVKLGQVNRTELGMKPAA